MDTMVFYAPDAFVTALGNLKKTPFAKVDSGYQFAYWVYDLNDSEEHHNELVGSFHGKEAAELVEKAKEELSNITITEEDYLSWTVYKKDAGGIKQYHKIIHDLFMRLLLLSIDKTADDIINPPDASLIGSEAHCDVNTLYELANERSNDSVKYVLNRHNPFADVTIKSQQYFYKTETGETETLFFNTNNIIEKIDKNGQDMLAMHPGFTVSKEHGVVQKPIRKVTFANSITEPIVGDEDHIYIHID